MLPRNYSRPGIPYIKFDKGLCGFKKLGIQVKTKKNFVYTIEATFA